MKKLSQQSFAAARSFLREQGRPLERALFAVYFESAAADAALSCLAAFQNEDGGFGRCFEPDLRTPESSAVATSGALTLLVELGAPSDSDLVLRTGAYLRASLDRERLVWPIAPASRERYPSAPWWTGADLVERFNGCRANPTAEIAAGLLHYSGLLPVHWLEELEAALDCYFESLPARIEFHDLLCFLKLYDREGISDHVRSKLEQAALNAVTRDSSSWLGYCAKPLWLAPSPDALSARVLEPWLGANLDFEIEQQAGDGSWSPFWNWQGRCGWAAAERDWRSILTLKTLLSLRAYNRIM